MADHALFIGWGSAARGREQKALTVFGESLAYWSELQKQGQIESFEVAILYPHGGDLNGFALLRGSRGQLDQVRTSAEFQRLVTRAQLVVDGVGVVDANTGASLEEQLGVYQAQLQDLA